MIGAITILFGLIGGALMIDVAFNEGSAISSIIGSFRGKRQEEDEKMTMCRKLLDEIDSLRDDLEYDCSPIEKDNILQKIAIREKLLEKLL